MRLYDEWQKSLQELKRAQGWMDIPKGPRYLSDSFGIYPEHCVVKLKRCGQQYQGGQNYWDAPECLTKALTTVILRRQGELLAEAMDVLRDAAIEKGQKCKSELESATQQIEATAV